MFDATESNKNSKYEYLGTCRMKKTLKKVTDSASVMFSSLAVSINSFMFGLNLKIMECAYTSFVTPGESGRKSESPSVTQAQFDNAVSIIMLGAFCANFIIPFMSYKKKNSLIINGVFNFVGFILLFLARNFYMLLISRIISGLGLGFAAALVPIYLGGISPVKFKGLFSAFHQVFLATGILLGSILSYSLKEDIKWKYSISLVIVISGMATILLFFIKDTKVVRRDQSKTLLDLLTNPLAKRSIRTGVLLHFIQQLSLINPVIFFSSRILGEGKGKNFSSLMVGITILFSSILCMLFVDKFGRKKLLIISMLVDSVSLFGILYKRTAVFSVYLYLLGFAMGLGPIVGFITGEIFPEEYKVPGAMLLSALNWMLSFLTSYIFPKLSELQMELSFASGSVLLILGAFYVYFQFKETKGRVSAFQ